MRSLLMCFLVLLLIGCTEETGSFPSIEEDALAKAGAISEAFDAAEVRFTDLSVRQIECGGLPATGVFSLSIGGDLGPVTLGEEEIENRLLKAFDGAGWEVAERAEESWGHFTYLSHRKDEDLSAVIMVSQAPIRAAFGTGCYSELADDPSALEEKLREMLVGG